MSSVTIKLFVRQSFTQAGFAEQTIVQEVLDMISTLPANPIIVTGETAQNAESFRKQFETTTGKPFTPRDFRDERLKLLNSADAMIVIRTGLSESSAFEIAYNVYGGPRLPMFFAVWEQAPIKTTLLQELDDLCDVRYHSFSQVSALREPLSNFLRSLPKSR